MLASSRASSPHVKPGWHRNRALHCRPGGRQPVQLSREGRTASALDLLRSRQLLTQNCPTATTVPTVQPCDPTPTCRRLTENWHPILRVFLPFVAAYYLSFLFRTINATVAGSLTSEFGLSAGDLGLLTSVYYLTFAAAQLPIGILLDRYGPG